MTLSFPSGSFESEVWTDSSNGGTITKIGYSDQKTHTLAMQDLTNAGYVIGAAHPTQTAYRLSTRTVTPLSVDETIPGATNTRHYRVNLEYSNSAPSGVATGDEIWTINIQNQTQRITSVDGYQVVNGVVTSKPQLHYPTTVNTGAAIGLTSDGEAEGVDVYRPQMTLTCQKSYAAFDYADTGGIPWNHIKAFSFPKHCYNSVAMNWHGMPFGVGELLFLGASATKQDSKWIVTYQFVAAPWSSYSVALVGGTATVGPSGANLTAMPWDAVWASKRERVSGGYRKVNLLAVHAATVYNAADLKDLGLTGPDGLVS